MIFIIAHVDIENALTQTVDTIILPVILFEEQGDIIFDVNFLKDNEKKMLLNAINPSLTYIEIEMFFIDGNRFPNFGPDYEFFIEDNLLKGNYIRKKWLEERKKKNG